MSLPYLVIGITGSKGSGKTLIAKYLQEHYDFETYALADPIKQGLQTMLGIDPRMLGSGDKSQIEPNTGKTYRKLLTSLGTDWGRDMIHPEVWIQQGNKRIAETIGKNGRLVIEDIRFDNEAEAVIERGGLILKILSNRKGEQGEHHKSEKGISNDLVDHVVINNETTDLVTLYEQLDTFIKHT